MELDSSGLGGCGVVDLWLGMWGWGGLVELLGCGCVRG